jgi:hypothetical protein
MGVKEQDWRLQGQEKYLQGTTLKFGTWVSNNPENDHYHWVCVECFNDFSKQFNWVVIK